MNPDPTPLAPVPPDCDWMTTTAGETLCTALMIADDSSTWIWAAVLPAGAPRPVVPVPSGRTRLVTASAVRDPDATPTTSATAATEASGERTLASAGWRVGGRVDQAGAAWDGPVRGDS